MSEVNSIEEDVSAIRAQQADQQILVDARDAAIRLASNPDFRKLILQGYMLTECARYVQESCDPMLTPAQRADALAIAQSSGHLKRFLSLTIQIGNTAADNVRQCSDEIDSILSGDNKVEE